MCTVTYLPQATGFILTHNRDEAPSRASKWIVREKTARGETLLFPRDPGAGGTWIATSDSGKTACLLNGAFVLHQRQLPYRRSRGLILLDFFEWEDPAVFFRDYDFTRIEPFTFLFFEQCTAKRTVSQVVEFRWDGQQRYLKNLPVNEPHFWCSATLYPKEMQVRREQVFLDWLKVQATQAPISSHAITRLHLKGGVGDPENDFVMNRGGKVQTVSLTQVIADEKNARMRYFDLLGVNRSERRLKLRERKANAVNR